MSSLEFPITNITNRGLRLDVTVAADTIKPAEAPPLPLENVAVSGTFSLLIDQILFQGTVETEFFHSCDRCLENARFPVSVPVVWTFEEGQPRDYVEQQMAEAVEDDEVEALGVFFYNGTAIDLAPPVWDEVALAMPDKFICRDDCRGLCPVCGGNRNTDPCACEDNSTNEETSASNSGFAGLKEMFPDLPE